MGALEKCFTSKSKKDVDLHTRVRELSKAMDEMEKQIVNMRTFVADIDLLNNDSQTNDLSDRVERAANNARSACDDRPSRALIVHVFGRRVNGEFVLRACLSHCVCRALESTVLVKIAVVPIVWSVAPSWRCVVVVAAGRVVVVHVASRVEAAPVCGILAVLSLSLVSLLLMDHRGFEVTRVRFAVLDPKVGTLNHLTLRRIHNDV